MFCPPSLVEPLTLWRVGRWSIFTLSCAKLWCIFTLWCLEAFIYLRFNTLKSKRVYGVTYRNSSRHANILRYGVLKRLCIFTLWCVETLRCIHAVMCRSVEVYLRCDVLTRLCVSTMCWRVGDVYIYTVWCVEALMCIYGVICWSIDVYLRCGVLKHWCVLTVWCVEAVGCI